MPRRKKAKDSKARAPREDKWAVNKRILNLLEELTTSNYVGHFPGLPPIQGIEAYKQFASGFFRAFPDLQTTLEDLIAEGDKVAVHRTWRGTHTGDFQGIHPTGKHVTFTSIEIYRFVNGRLAEEWVELDRLGLWQQLGAIK
jgi:predicted ester cyclase